LKSLSPFSPVHDVYCFAGSDSAVACHPELRWHLQCFRCFNLTNTGPTVVNGNLGLSPGSAVSGFPPSTVVSGTIHVAHGPANTAQSDLTAAYIDAAGRTTAVTVSSDIGGTTLTPGPYKSTSSLGITAVLHLDGLGDPNSVFIIRVMTALTTATSSQIILQANIFWQVGSSATLGTYSTFSEYPSPLQPAQH
jgi:hypothetical protein